MCLSQLRSRGGWSPSPHPSVRLSTLQICMAYQELDAKQGSLRSLASGGGGKARRTGKPLQHTFCSPPEPTLVILLRDVFGHGGRGAVRRMLYLWDLVDKGQCGSECFWKTPPFSLPLLPRATATPKSSISNRNSGSLHEESA